MINYLKSTRQFNRNQQCISNWFLRFSHHLCPCSSRFLALLQLLIIATLMWRPAEGNSDSQCCRKKIACFECDSRYDARCGDQFNLTRETATLVMCDDLCVKLKHKVENKFHYLRTCADTIKKIYIKKTEVCYASRSKEGGNLCFCEQDLCNSASALLRWTKRSGTLGNLQITSISMDLRRVRRLLELGLVIGVQLIIILSFL